MGLVYSAGGPDGQAQEVTEMRKTQERLNRQGENTIIALRNTVRAIWEKMCAEDSIPADSSFVVFSDETNDKYGPFYNQALRQLSEARAAYSAGGYVGLRIVNGKATQC